MQAGMLKTIAGAVAIDGSRGKAQVAAIGAFIDEVARLGPEAGPLRGEVFRFSSPDVRSSIEGALHKGVPVELLADHAEAAPGLKSVAVLGGKVAPYGSAAGEQAELGAEQCMHAKLWTRGDQALLPTASAAIGGEHQLNLSFRFSGPAASAADAATASAMSGNVERQRAALDAARDAGVLFNEPSVGARHVDDAMGLLVDNAEHRLSLVIKEFTVPAWAERVAAAQRRGVQTSVLTREMTPEVRRILTEAGVHEEIVPFSRTPGLREVLGQRLHFNAVFADMPDAREAARMRADGGTHSGAAVIGTRYLWDPTKPGDRSAREIALALDGDNAIDAQRAVDGHVGLNHLQVLKAAITGR